MSETGSAATPVVIIGPADESTPHWGPWTDDTTKAARAIGGYVVVIDSDPPRVLEDFRGQAPRDLRIVATSGTVAYGPDCADRSPVVWAIGWLEDAGDGETPARLAGDWLPTERAAVTGETAPDPSPGNGWECDTCGWPWPLPDAPQGAECDNCGGDLVPSAGAGGQ